MWVGGGLCVPCKASDAGRMGLSGAVHRDDAGRARGPPALPLLGHLPGLPRQAAPGTPEFVCMSCGGMREVRVGCRRWVCERMRGRSMCVRAVPCPGLTFHIRTFSRY
eukprot:3803879-Rhodomonas_salina.6